MRKCVPFKTLLNKTIIKIDNFSNDKLKFYCSDNTIYEMYHAQDCCENVILEEIIGDLNNLLHTPILTAEERTDENLPAPSGYGDDAEQWTFYELRTIKGSVTLRWFGCSNGYYSIDVDFVQTQ